MPSDARARLWCLALLLIPAVGPAAARFAGGGVAAASAQTVPPMPTLPDLTPTPLPDSGASSPKAFSPFWYENARPGNEHVAEPPPQPVRVETPQPRPAPVREDPLPTFTLTALMPSRTRPLAVVNGHPAAIGDEVAPGWRLTDIDGPSRRVTLTSAEGRQITVTLQSGRKP